MSFLSTTENVGFAGIPQTISEASCASQYKMGVEGVSGGGDMNIFIHDSSGDEQNYIPHLNDNFFHSKFKIDPNDLYTFHDSDVIAGEITVSHTEDSFVFQENLKTKVDSPTKVLDIEITPNSEIKEEINTDVVLNGHQPSAKIAISGKNTNVSKPTNTKAPKVKNQLQVSKEPNKTNEIVDGSFVPTAKQLNLLAPPNSCNTVVNRTNNGQATKSSKGELETFLDVFKREQRVSQDDIKSEPTKQATPMKHIITAPKKTPQAKTTSQSKPKRGRGPTVHEALQRIPPQNRVIAKNNTWHAPGEELYSCGPLNEQLPNHLKHENSSSDDDYMPNTELSVGPVCVEEFAAESRGARLALRRAALRRHLASVHTKLELASDGHVKGSKALIPLVKRQLKQCPWARMPTTLLNDLLANRRMTSLLTSRERRRIRQHGWSGGESVQTESSTCAEERCQATPLPCNRYCLSHVTSSEQRLFASCAAVFAGGARCKQALLPLRQHTPLCAEHAWKRDNYDKLSRDSRAKKPAANRKRVRAPPRPRAVPPAPQPPAATAAAPAVAAVHNEVSVCSNSSAYDSSEETAMGALSETEYITTANDVQELEVEVGQVPADDILDASVLSQIPDVAFTEFFNQAEGGPQFAESSDLAAALEAVLDERGLDEERPLETMEYTTYTQIVKNKIPVATSVSLELSSSAPS